MGQEGVSVLQLLRHRPIRVGGVHQQAHGVPCGGHPAEEVSLVFQEFRRAEESRLSAVGVQGVQLRGGAVSRPQAEIHAFSALRGEVDALGDILCAAAVRPLFLQVLLIPHGDLTEGGVDKVLFRQAEIGLPEPDQGAVAGLAGGVDGQGRHGVLQVEELRHQRRRDKDLPAPPDGPPEGDIAVGVPGKVAVEVKHQRAVARVQDAQVGIGDAAGEVGYPQGLVHLPGEDGAGHVQVSLGPEGHGGVVQGKDVVARRGDIHAACGLRRQGGKAQGQGKTQGQCRRSFFHSPRPLSNFEQINLLYHDSWRFVKSAAGYGSTVTPV